MGLDALLVGELVSENGCLRLRNVDHGTDHLLIWPDTAGMTADGEGVRVRDDSGVTLSFSVGEGMQMGGGEMPLDHVQRRVVHPIPSNCQGPYWFVGRGIEAY